MLLDATPGDTTPGKPLAWTVYSQQSIMVYNAPNHLALSSFQPCPPLLPHIDIHSAFHSNRCLILKSHITLENSKALPTSLPLLLLLTLLTRCSLSPAFPTWLTSNSSKHYGKHQLLCKSSPSLVTAWTRIFPLLSLDNSPSRHLFHCILIVSLQVFASARLWPPENMDGTSLTPEPRTMCGPCLLISTYLCLIISRQRHPLDLIN